MGLFTSKDFEVFDLAEFEERMQAIRTTIRPKLERVGELLSPALAGLVDLPLYAHVAKHARRTVHPPDDTWVAFGPDRRGYKKDIHFKIAISGNCVRLLFEVGPEYYDKNEWALAWMRDSRFIAEVLTSDKKLAWFENEHDETPQGLLHRLQPSEVRKLAEALHRRREGQLVVGRRLDVKSVIKQSEAGFKRTASTTFRNLAPLFSLHVLRRAS